MLGLRSNGEQTRTANMPLHHLPNAWEWDGVRSALPPLCCVGTCTRLTNTNIAMSVLTWKQRHARPHFKGFLFIASIFPEGLIVRTHEEDGAYLWKALQGILGLQRVFQSDKCMIAFRQSACFWICISLDVFFVAPTAGKSSKCRFLWFAMIDSVHFRSDSQPQASNCRWGCFNNNVRCVLYSHCKTIP